MFYSDSIKIVDYLDGFQYAGGELNFFPHPEGYVSVKRGGRTAPDGSQGYVFNYVYNYTDHLGNVRVSYSKDPQTNQLKILEENHYYPFGLKHSVYSGGRLRGFEVREAEEDQWATSIESVTKTEYQYKFGAKEWQDELGLGWYDYHARNYDPALGRWNVIDPMAPEYFSHSPYAYTLNNPVYFIDPTGMMAEIGNLLGNGDPVEICEGCLVELEEALITAKDTQKSSSFGSRSRSGSLMTMSGFSSSRYSRVGNFWDAAYRNMLSPENKADYLKMRQAMHEGQVGVVVLFSSVVALPYAVTYGSVAVSSIESSALISSGQTALGNVITNQKVTEFLLRFSLDIGTQAIFNGGDFKLSDVTGAAVGALPFVPWYASGFAAEGTGLGTKALMGDQIDSNDVWSAGIKSFMISPLGAASGNAMEAVTNKTAGQVIEAVHNNAQGAMIDDQLSH